MDQAWLPGWGWPKWGTSSPTFTQTGFGQFSAHLEGGVK